MPLPAEITGDELAVEARRELRALPRELATLVARHLVMVGQLLEEDPETAYRHAMTARGYASRIGVVREACGLAAYRAGHWADALNELRAARRMSGDDTHLPIMADCERGLGRPERALEIAKSPEARALAPEGRIELRIVEAGARRDLGQHEAAIVALQIPELSDRRLRPWSARLLYAYADALAEGDRQDEAQDWFARAAAADRMGETDAAERYAELAGLEIVDVEGGVDDAADAADVTEVTEAQQEEAHEAPSAGAPEDEDEETGGVMPEGGSSEDPKAAHDE